MLNELSLVFQVESREEICQILEEFVRANLEAKGMGLDELRIHENTVPSLYNISFNESYTLQHWLSDNRIEQDIRDKFKEIVSTFPLIKETEVRESYLYKNSQFFKQINTDKIEVWGLGAAYIYGTLAFSIATHEDWECSSVDLSHQYFKDCDGQEMNEDIEIVEEIVSVKHFYNIETLRIHNDWWIKFRTECLETSSDLWKNRQEMFPNLILCGEVENQLQKIGISKMLTQIIERLNELNDYVRNWKVSDFNYDEANKTTNLRISPESFSTMKRFGSLRRFNVPGQGKKIFELHIKTGDLRFHFYPDNTSKRVYVGYIGKHLRIASEK
ncbi:MAG: hypothetical protein ACTHJ0_01510 [Flavipsychrobacter sp.]